MREDKNQGAALILLKAHERRCLLLGLCAPQSSVVEMESKNAKSEAPVGLEKLERALLTISSSRPKPPDPEPDDDEGS